MKSYAGIGIDLGTSNSALAVADADSPALTMVPLKQVHGSAAVVDALLLPSALCFLPDAELKEMIRLPWEDAETQLVVGAYARRRGVELPDRLIVSAKSWLCHAQVDRKADILPWKSTSVPRKLSPVAASERLLRHLSQCFYHCADHSGWEPRTAGVDLVIAVPASFDSVARNLTYEAAVAAGLASVRLLEEPQAAMYAWIDNCGDSWREQVQAGDLVLVCDVGGGTADFSIVAVSEEDGHLRLDRVSVGEHILLGGDNIDMALAYGVRGRLAAEGTDIDEWQFLSLIQSAREVKEKLLSTPELLELPVSLPGRSANLFAGTVATVIKRDELDPLLAGFFPDCAVTEQPLPQRSAGLQEYGLPYATDPAFSKHLARFLTRSWENVCSDVKLQALVGDTVEFTRGGFLRPTAVLFNGGVFKAETLRRRVLDLLGSWSGDRPPRELEGADLDLAVARGAAFYARCRALGEEIRIRAGCARSYYIGLEASLPAVPGYRPPLKGLCVVPQGMEEGSELAGPETEFGLIVGDTVHFRFFNSNVRAGDQIGAVVANAEVELEESAGLELALPALEGTAGQLVPVRLQSKLTELGTLELWMQHTQSERRWKLEYDLRSVK